jgi:hypothetical protein
MDRAPVYGTGFVEVRVLSGVLFLFVAQWIERTPPESEVEGSSPSEEADLKIDSYGGRVKRFPRRFHTPKMPGFDSLGPLSAVSRGGTGLS